MTYRLVKRIIAKGNYDKDELMDKLDVFLLAGRITDEQYKELAEMMKDSEIKQLKQELDPIQES